MNAFRLAGWCMILVIGLASCQPMQDIELKSVDAFRVTSVEENRLFAEIQITLSNPNDYTFQVKNADIDIYLNELKLGKTKLQESWKIPKSSFMQHTVKIRTELDQNFQEQLPQLALAALGNNLKVRLKGEVKGSMFLFNRSFAVDAEQPIDLSDFQLNL